MLADGDAKGFACSRFLVSSDQEQLIDLPTKTMFDFNYV
jgi:hypothetical protein